MTKRVPDMTKHGHDTRAATTYSRALEIVHALATMNTVDEQDILDVNGDMYAMKAQQDQALDMLSDLIDNHHEELDDRFPVIQLQEPTDPSKLQVDVGDLLDRPSVYIKVCLAMAEQVPSADPDKEAIKEAALLAVESLLANHGEELDRSILVVTSPISMG